MVMIFTHIMVESLNLVEAKIYFLSSFDGFYCLNCPHSFAAKSKLKPRKKVCENKDFCNILMPSEDTKILEFNQNEKPDKTSFNIYADLECLIEKIDRFKNNPESSSSTKISKQILSGFSMSTISSFKNIENKHDGYRGQDCVKKFCEFLREHAMEITNFKKKKLELIRN